MAMSIQQGRRHAARSAARKTTARRIACLAIHIAATAACLPSAALTECSAPGDPGLNEAARKHLERASKWYLPSRLGVFYHWGLFTGGGLHTTDKKRYKPLTYPTPEAFEAAAGDPARVADNFVESALAFGAKYVILTAWHTCEAHMAIYPTEIPDFRNKTKNDYIGPYLDAAHKAGLKAMVYFPSDSHNWDVDPQNPTIDPRTGKRGGAYYVDFIGRVLRELKSRYGDRIDGFWIDGGMHGKCAQIPAKIRELWPDALVVGNCVTDFRVDVDVSTTEICPAKDVRPAYCRPEGFRRVSPWGGALPQRDLNEDDLLIGYWWYTGELDEKNEFVRDPRMLVKRIVTSLGQRGRWNCTIGLGPTVDGTLPKYMKAMTENLRAFLAWASPAIYGTKGSAGTFFDPGWAGAVNGPTCAAFYSVTQSMESPNVFYAIVTEARTAKRNKSVFQTNGRSPRRVSDLRTGREYRFSAPFGTVVENIDWSDIETYGATILKFEF